MDNVLTQSAERIVYSIKNSNEWCGIAGIERGSNSLLWVVFYTGGTKEPHPKNKVVISRSFDGGESWTDPMTIVDPEGTKSAWDPALWLDEDKRLWLFYNIADHNFENLYCYRYAQVLLNKGTLKFSKPQRIVESCLCFGLNHPIRISNGDWILPLVFIDESSERRQKWYYMRPQSIGVAISKDKGKNWSISTKVSTPDRFCNENMIYERENGSLRMLARTAYGVLWECISFDGGNTWGDMMPTNILNPSSRFSVSKLRSGKVLLIYNPSGNVTQGANAREKLNLAVSKDDGKTWFKDRTFKEGRWVAYPDVVEDEHEYLHLVYDVSRSYIAYNKIDINIY